MVRISRPFQGFWAGRAIVYIEFDMLAGFFKLSSGPLGRERVRV